jgi:mRNA-degrading endonuclease RelE of RelBE toxin-antitoxin system
MTAKILLTVLLVAVLASSTLPAQEAKHEMFDQLCVLLDLDGADQKKLGVAFVTLQENLYAATKGVGHDNPDAKQVLSDFQASRKAFRDSVETFLSPEQYDQMMDYSSAIVYALAENIARVHVGKYRKSLNLTDDQVTALTLVVGEDLRSVVETCLVYEGQDVKRGVADSMSKDLGQIRKNTRDQVKRILSQDQWDKFQKM